MKFEYSIFSSVNKISLETPCASDGYACYANLNSFTVKQNGGDLTENNF